LNTAFHSYADPDPASQNNADPDPQFRRKNRKPLKTRVGPVGQTETRTTGQHKKVKEQKENKKGPEKISEERFRMLKTEENVGF
jgi:hypothetical protein